MAKLENKLIKIFSSGATGAIEQFGTTKAGSPVYSDDPNIIMGFTGATGHTGLTGVNAWTEGLFAGVTGDNVIPFQSMNAIFYVLTRFLKAYQEYGIPRWQDSITYSDGDSIVSDSEGNLFEACSFNPLNVSLSTIASWALIFSNKVRFITDNYTIQNDDMLLIWNVAATGSINTIQFPSFPVFHQTNREIIICVAGDTSVSSVYVKSSGGATIDTIDQYLWRKYTYKDSWSTVNLFQRLQQVLLGKSKRSLE